MIDNEHISTYVYQNNFSNDNTPNELKKKQDLHSWNDDL